MKTKRRRRQQPDPPQGQKLSVPQKAAKMLEVPLSAFGGIPSLELTGNREMTVEGCKGVLEYDEDVVKLNLGKMILQVRGRDLNIKGLTDDSAVLEGYFLSIEFLT